MPDSSQLQTFISWLNDAYAMELDIIQVLEAHSGQASEFPEIRERVDEHLEETKNHAEVVKNCIEKLDGSISGVKSTLASLMGSLKSAGSVVAGDRIIKNAIAESATERMEIVTYIALVSAAEELGESEIAEELYNILEEERAMEEWLEQNIDELATELLSDQAE